MNEQRIVKQSMEPMNRSRPLGIIVAAAFTVIAGLAEVVTGFTHNFFGITTSSVTVFTYSSAVIGLFYIAAGLLILTMRRWAAALALVLLGADIVGRIVLVFTGLYPTSSLKNTLSFIAGTVIVALVALYIVWKWKSLGEGKVLAHVHQCTQPLIEYCKRRRKTCHASHCDPTTTPGCQT